MLILSKLYIALPSFIITMVEENGIIDHVDRPDTKSTDTKQPIPVGSPLTLTPNEIHQYRVAGLPLDQELPGGHFPHGPAKRLKVKNKAKSKKVENQAKPAPRGPANGLARQHLAALTQVLHRCLSDGDYQRAGRAWGLLLRENFEGCRAGSQIGAQILLRRGVQHCPSDADEAAHTPVTFTIKGFAEAKVYYEKLILAHPYSKSAPHLLSALHFYPAMFEHWIVYAQEVSSLERKKIENDEMSDEEDFDYDDQAFHKKQTRISAVRTQELEQARQIAIRIDGLLGKSPYSDSAKLLELRGMVSLWIGDLLMSSLAPTPFQQGEQSSDEILTDGLYSPYESQHGHNPTVEKRRHAEEQRLLEFSKAREFLEQAKQRGTRLAYDLNDFEISLDDSKNILYDTDILV